MNEVIAVPFVQLGQADNGDARIDLEPTRISVDVVGLTGQLFFELIGPVGLIAKRRAAHGRTDECEVDSRLGELGADLLVFDLVETPFVSPHIPADGVPAIAGGNILDRVDRIVVEDQRQSERVVGVDEERQSLVASELVEGLNQLYPKALA